MRLLLVSDEFQQTGAIRALPLGGSPGFPFRSAAALATPRGQPAPPRGLGVGRWPKGVAVTQHDAQLRQARTAYAVFELLEQRDRDALESSGNVR